MEHNTITVVLVEPGKPAQIAEIPKELKAYQKLVGGLIEASHPFPEDVCIVCNDEGKIRGKKANRAIYDKNGKLIDIIAGTFFVCDCSGSNFDSLSEEQQQRYLERFRLPEMFFDINGEIVVKRYLQRYEKVKAELRSLENPRRETRRFFAEILVDESFNDKYPQIGPGDFLEEQLNSLAGTGIKLGDWVIADADDEEPRAKYIQYLFEWCMKHAEQFDGSPESPLTFEQWLN